MATCRTAIRMISAAHRAFFVLGFVAIALALPPLLAAAQSENPTLHRRGAPAAKDHPPAVTTGTSTLPPDVSREYVLGDNGEAIEIELEPQHLDGYLSLRGDQTSDKGTPLTYFFTTSTLNGVEVGFVTERIHDAWYSFKGTIVRGKAESPDEQGYYMLEGTLTHHSAGGQDQPRFISLPSASQTIP